MINWIRKIIGNKENLIVLFIFLILFVLPVLFTKVEGVVSWRNVFKIWLDQSLLIPIFLINHWVLAPRLMLKKKYISFFASVFILIGVCAFSYYYYDEVINEKPLSQIQANDRSNPPQRRNSQQESQRPTPIPPYAHLLMYSLLIVGVDTGLLLSKEWHNNEEKKHILEKENAEMKLGILRNQVSPHFFMNTLNNIYALIDCNTPKAKEAVMKLSKLMRYMLYENEQGKVKLSKEFEFISSYIDLMKLRFAEDLSVNLVLPSNILDIEIPPMLFISFIDNAFKHGASYQKESSINIIFEIRGQNLLLTCINTKNNNNTDIEKGGLGLQNSINRLDLIYGKNYSLTINSGTELYSVELNIPIV